MDKNTEKLYALKVNAYRWYKNTEIDPSVPETSDKEYDELEKELGIRGLSLVDFDEKVVNYDVEDRMDKITEDDFVKTVNKTVSKLNSYYIINYKYDGSAIRAEYHGGKLVRIISTPDEDTCLDVTNKFYDFFPKEVREDILHIRGEVIVDPEVNNFGQKARNKANGLLCSKYMIDEINSYAQIRAYNIKFIDGKYDFNRLIKALDELPETDKFKIAERINVDQIPTSPIVKSPKGDSILVDGIVIYTESKRFAIKFYFTEIQKTQIKDIEWRYNESNGSYVPTYIIDPVILNEKTIRKVATGGVKNMIKDGGIGTNTFVILSKMTIPKIYTNDKYVPEIVSGDYGNHVCDCGTVLNLENDIFGSALKCPNKKCSRRIQDKKSLYRSDKDWVYNLQNALGIDRLKITNISDEFISDLNELKTEKDIDIKVEKFIELFKSQFKLSEIQVRLLELNAYAFCLCI